MHWFFEGGPMMPVLAAAFAVCLPVTLLRMLLHRRTTFPGMTAAMIGVLLGFGAAGTGMGAIQAMDAVAHASPQMKAPLLQAGLEVASYSVLFAGLLLLAIVPPHGLAAVRERRPSARWWGIAVGMSVPVVLLVLVTIVAWIVVAASMSELTSVLASSMADPAREARIMQRMNAALLTAMVAAPLAVPAGVLTGVGSLIAAAVAWQRNQRSPQEDPEA